MNYYEFLTKLDVETDNIKKELFEIQKVLEKENKFLLVDNTPQSKKKFHLAKYGFMFYSFGLLIVVRKEESEVVFFTDTKALCSFYKEGGKYRVIPYFGANKGKMMFEIARCLVEGGIEFEVDEDNEAFEGPWSKELSIADKVGLGIPKEILNLKAVQRYLTSVARELIPIVQEEIKKQSTYEYILQTIDTNRMPRA